MKRRIEREEARMRGIPETRRNQIESVIETYGAILYVLKPNSAALSQFFVFQRFWRTIGTMEEYRSKDFCEITDLTQLQLVYPKISIMCASQAISKVAFET